MFRAVNAIPATTIGLITRSDHASFSHKHPRTSRILGSLGVHRVQNASRVVSPSGTTHHGALFEFGHPNLEFETPTNLTPRMQREIGGLLYRARQRPGTIHVFGMVDSESPLGSYRLLESLIRFLLEGNDPIAIHAGVWSPTPREFRQAYHDLLTFANRDNVSLASIFPTDVLQSRNKAAQFIDGLHQPQASDPDFPFNQPHIFTPFEVTGDDIFLSLLAPSRETEVLRQAIEDRFPLNHTVSLTHQFNSDQTVKKTLGQSKHILAMANNPSYIEAYFGSELAHPYFETMVVESPVELLEMLISPHFGYASAPHRTAVLLDELNGNVFDWLLASYIRKNMTTPFLFYVVNPHELQDSVVYSNQVEATDKPITHQDVHWYGP